MRLGWYDWIGDASLEATSLVKSGNAWIFDIGCYEVQGSSGPEESQTSVGGEQDAVAVCQKTQGLAAY